MFGANPLGRGSGLGLSQPPSLPQRRHFFPIIILIHRHDTHLLSCWTSQNRPFNLRSCRSAYLRLRETAIRGLDCAVGPQSQQKLSPTCESVVPLLLSSPQCHLQHHHTLSDLIASTSSSHRVLEQQGDPRSKDTSGFVCAQRFDLYQPKESLTVLLYVTRVLLIFFITPG